MATAGEKARKEKINSERKLSFDSAAWELPLCP